MIVGNFSTAVRFQSTNNDGHVSTAYGTTFGVLWTPEPCPYVSQVTFLLTQSLLRHWFKFLWRTLSLDGYYLLI